MPVVIPEGYAQFTLNYSITGAQTGRGATVLGFGGPGEIVGTADEFAEEIADAWLAWLANETNTLVALDSVYWQTATQSGLVAAGHQGVRTGDLEMVNVAFLTSYYTGFKGRRGRGRSYWPGQINSADTGDNALIQTGRMANLTAAHDAFWTRLEDVGDLTSQQVILQRDEPEQKSPPLSPPPAVTRRQYSNRPATQRRRLRR